MASRQSLIMSLYNEVHKGEAEFPDIIEERTSTFDEGTGTLYCTVNKKKYSVGDMGLALDFLQKTVKNIEDNLQSSKDPYMQLKKVNYLSIAIECIKQVSESQTKIGNGE